MKKALSRSLSLALSAILVLAALPLSFASAADTTMQDDLSKVENLSAIISDTSKNIIHSWGNSDTENTPLTFYTTYTNSAVTNQKFQSSAANVARMTNGDYNDTHGDLSGGLQWFSNKEWVEGYIDVTFNFPATASITNFLLASDKVDPSDRRIWEYQVFAGNDLDTLYSDTNLLYHYNEGGSNTPTDGQYITFGETVEAKYFGLRILKGCNPNSDENRRSYSYPRIREMAIIGSCEVPEELKITSSFYVNPCIEALDTDYNLLNSDYVAGDGSAGTIIAKGFDGTKEVSGNIRSYNPDACDLVDHVLTGQHADITGVKFFNSNNTFNEGVYLTLSVALVHEATIDKFFISHAVNNTYNLRTYEYEVYTSNTSMEDLYNAENKRAYFLNDKAIQNQVFIFDTPIVAKYVGVKILKGVQPNCTNPGASDARIAELAVFGKYNVDDCNYTVTSGAANIISESGSIYYGKKLSFSAPLCQNGYTLRDWKINGESVEYTSDRYNNISNVEFKITKDTEVEAVYTEDDGEFTSNDSYVVSKDKTLIRIPQHSVLYELRYGFEQYPQNISAKRGDTQLEDKSFLKRGDTLILSSNGSQKQVLSVVIAGDCNYDSAVTATDVVSGIETILGGKTTQNNFLLLDVNNSNSITVSDIVNMRNTILTTPETETDYTTATTAMADLDYKQQGRNIVNANGTLYLDWTAAGFSFNADLYGDIVLNVKQEHNDTRWYTVVIDDEEYTVAINGNTTQDVLIARGVSSGIHSVGFYKQGEGGQRITINSVKINGKVLEADAQSDLLIEFVGDSITCGALNLVASGQESSTNHTQDGYNAYGTITARMLGADWSNISVSGSSLIDDRAKVQSRSHMPTEYTKNIKGGEALWDFENNRNADIVVVNLGTNDSGFISSYATGYDNQVEYFADLAYDFAKQIIVANGEDVKIVFATGMMRDYNFTDDAYLATIEKLKADDNYTNAFYCRLPKDNSGGSGHPQVAGDIAAAEVLAEFISETVLAK